MAMDQSIEWWNALGTWIAGLGTVGSVITALGLARKGEALQKASEERKNAAELYALFTSLEMWKARHGAGEYLRGNIEEIYPLTFQGLHKERRSKPEEFSNVSQLLEFWQKVHHMIEAGYVDKLLAKEFFKSYLETQYRDFLRRFAEICENKPDEANYLRWVVSVRALVDRWGIQH